MEESAITREHGNLREALEKGKEAGKKEPSSACGHAGEAESHERVG